MQCSPNSRRNLINPDAAYAIARSHQRRGYISGEALKSHADSAHGGVALESCPACRDIQRQMEILMRES